MNNITSTDTDNKPVQEYLLTPFMGAVAVIFVCVLLVLYKCAEYYYKKKAAYNRDRRYANINTIDMTVPSSQPLEERREPSNSPALEDHRSTESVPIQSPP